MWAHRGLDGTWAMLTSVPAIPTGFIFGYFGLIWWAGAEWGKRKAAKDN